MPDPSSPPRPEDFGLTPIAAGPPRPEDFGLQPDEGRSTKTFGGEEYTGGGEATALLNRLRNRTATREEEQQYARTGGMPEGAGFQRKREPASSGNLAIGNPFNPSQQANVPIPVPDWLSEGAIKTAPAVGGLLLSPLVGAAGAAGIENVNRMAGREPTDYGDVLKRGAIEGGTTALIGKAGQLGALGGRLTAGGLGLGTAGRVALQGAGEIAGLGAPNLAMGATPHEAAISGIEGYLGGKLQQGAQKLAGKVGGAFRGRPGPEGPPPNIPGMKPPGGPEGGLPSGLTPEDRIYLGEKGFADVAGVKPDLEKTQPMPARNQAALDAAHEAVIQGKVGRSGGIDLQPSEPLRRPSQPEILDASGQVQGARIAKKAMDLEPGAPMKPLPEHTTPALEEARSANEAAIRNLGALERPRSVGEEYRAMRGEHIPGAGTMTAEGKWRPEIRGGAPSEPPELTVRATGQGGKEYSVAHADRDELHRIDPRAYGPKSERMKPGFYVYSREPGEPWKLLAERGRFENEGHGIKDLRELVGYTPAPLSRLKEPEYVRKEARMTREAEAKIPETLKGMQYTPPKGKTPPTMGEAEASRYSAEKALGEAKKGGYPAAIEAAKRKLTEAHEAVQEARRYYSEESEASREGAKSAISKVEGIIGQPIENLPRVSKQAPIKNKPGHLQKTLSTPAEIAEAKAAGFGGMYKAPKAPKAPKPPSGFKEEAAARVKTSKDIAARERARLAEKYPPSPEPTAIEKLEADLAQAKASEKYERGGSMKAIHRKRIIELTTDIARARAGLEPMKPVKPPEPKAGYAQVRSPESEAPSALEKLAEKGLKPGGMTGEELVRENLGLGPKGEDLRPEERRSKTVPREETPIEPIRVAGGGKKPPPKPPAPPTGGAGNFPPEPPEHYTEGHKQATKALHALEDHIARQGAAEGRPVKVRPEPAILRGLLKQYDRFRLRTMKNPEHSPGGAIFSPGASKGEAKGSPREFHATTRNPPDFSPDWFKGKGRKAIQEIHDIIGVWETDPQGGYLREEGGPGGYKRREVHLNEIYELQPAGEKPVSMVSRTGAGAGKPAEPAVAEGAGKPEGPPERAAQSEADKIRQWELIRAHEAPPRVPAKPGPGLLEPREPETLRYGRQPGGVSEMKIQVKAGESTPRTPEETLRAQGAQKPAPPPVKPLRAGEPAAKPRQKVEPGAGGRPEEPPPQPVRRMPEEEPSRLRKRAEQYRPERGGAPEEPPPLRKYGRAPPTRGEAAIESIMKTAAKGGELLGKGLQLPEKGIKGAMEAVGLPKSTFAVRALMSGAGLGTGGWPAALAAPAAGKVGKIIEGGSRKLRIIATHSEAPAKLRGMAWKAYSKAKSGDRSGLKAAAAALSASPLFREWEERRKKAR